jgi:hypothetical protein
MAKSIVVTYILSSLPAMALLTGQIIAETLKARHVPSHQNALNTTEISRIKGLLRTLPFLLGFASLLCLVYTLIVPSTMSTNTTALLGAVLTILVLFGLSWLAFKSTQAWVKPLQIGLLALFPVLGVTLFYLYFSTTLAYKKSMKPLLIALAQQRPEFASQPALFLAAAPPFSWFYYGQEALVNKQLALEKQHRAKPMILPEYDLTPQLPTDATTLLQPTVVIVNKKEEPSLLKQQALQPQLRIKPIASAGYYAAYLVQRQQ